LALALSLCRFNPFAGGTTDFVVSTALAGCAKPFDVGAVNAKVYRYYAAIGSQYESGFGAYSSSTQTVARTTIESSSSGGAKVNFASAPVVDLFGPWVNALTDEFANLPTSTLGRYSFPAGTLMLFQQTSAPTGWTKQTTHNDKALRVVSGTASSGGTNSFSSMFASRTSDATTLSIAQIPSHAHSELSMTADSSIIGRGPDVGAASDYEFYQYGTNTGANGGSGSHTHTYDMRVQYVDLIIAQKN
jgi:hypothetical protein